MISTEGLEGRVTLAGAIPHERARDFLVSSTWVSVPVMCGARCWGVVASGAVPCFKAPC